MNKNAFFSGACARAGLALLSALMIVLAAPALAHAASTAGGRSERAGSAGAASSASYDTIALRSARRMALAIGCQQQRTADFIYPEP